MRSCFVHCQKTEKTEKLDYESLSLAIYQRFNVFNIDENFCKIFLTGLDNIFSLM